MADETATRDAKSPRETTGGDVRKERDPRSTRVGVVIAVVLAVLLIGWLIVRDGDDSSAPESAEGAPEITSVESLRELATERGTPIYWAGLQDEAALELTQTGEGEIVYVRYLTGDAEAGEDSPTFLTVGTYAFPDAASALRKQAKGPGGVLRTAPNGGTVYYNRDHPQSVYLAYPGVDLQIEVYDPDPERALSLVTAGQIVPVS